MDIWVLYGLDEFKDYLANHAKFDDYLATHDRKEEQ